MKALGIHVFAGGFTAGVKDVFPVEAQLETHNFGGESVADLGVPFVNCDRWEDWPATDADFVFGNPRCTGFSCITAGQGEDTHGPWSKQTKDVHDLCLYAAKQDVQIVIWESVQQAYSVGRPLLDWLRDKVFAPRGYRVAHVFMNAASFGNAQVRRRYFFVAYKRGRNFNISAPTIPARQATVRDVIGEFVDRRTREVDFVRDPDYDRDAYARLNRHEKLVVPHLPQRCCLNRFARTQTAKLKEVCPKYYNTWVNRISERPFSMHCINRIQWDKQCPTLHSSSKRLIHPLLDRPLTVGELATIMGWGERVPRGLKPVAQIVKGVVPAAGEWLAQQALAYLKGEWGKEDWASKYNHQKGRWDGEWFKDEPLEKVFNMTHYSPPLEEIGQ